MEAQNAPEADSHVAVTRKVEIYLQQKRERVEPDEEDARVLRRFVDARKRAELVGEQNFLGKADREAAHALRRGGNTVRAAFELRGDIGIAHDRPRDELGKERNIGGEVDEIPLRCRLTAIDVDDVAEHLKGVEADADGQAQLQKRQGKPRDGVDAREEKVRVLKIAEKPKAHKDRECQKDLRRPLPTVLFDQQAEGIALHDGDEHQKHILRLAPGVEKEAREQQHRVFQLPRRCKVEQQRRGQKVEEKGNAGKEHGLLRLSEDQAMASSQATAASAKASVTFSLNWSTRSSAP